jgi:predicted enzyme related to lactoylglutathione lyase
MPTLDPRARARPRSRWINIVVRDMEKSLAFYRLLGVSIEEIRGAEWAEWARHHVNGTTSNGVRVEFDSVVPTWGGERVDYTYLLTMLEQRDAWTSAGG